MSLNLGIVILTGDWWSKSWTFYVQRMSYFWSFFYDSWALYNWVLSQNESSWNNAVFNHCNKILFKSLKVSQGSAEFSPVYYAEAFFSICKIRFHLSFVHKTHVKQEKKYGKRDSFEYCNLLFLYKSCLITGMICDNLEHFEVVVSRWYNFPIDELICVVLFTKNEYLLQIAGFTLGFWGCCTHKGTHKSE